MIRARSNNYLLSSVIALTLLTDIGTTQQCRWEVILLYLRPVPAKDSHQMRELHEKELYLWVLSFAIPRWQCGLNKNNASKHSGHNEIFFTIFTKKIIYQIYKRAVILTFYPREVTYSCTQCHEKARILKLVISAFQLRILSPLPHERVTIWNYWPRGNIYCPVVSLTSLAFSNHCVYKVVSSAGRKIMIERCMHHIISLEFQSCILATRVEPRFFPNFHHCSW